MSVFCVPVQEVCRLFITQRLQLRGQQNLTATTLWQTCQELSRAKSKKSQKKRPMKMGTAKLAAVFWRPRKGDVYDELELVKIVRNGAVIDS